jgi:hypothetical protein
MTSEYGRRYNALTDLYKLNKDVGSTKYGRYLDLAKIGAGAAGSAGSASMTAGANLSNIYQNQGNALSNIAMQQGQNQAQFYSGAGALPLQAYNAYQMYGGDSPSYPNAGQGPGSGSTPISTSNNSATMWRE